MVFQVIKQALRAVFPLMVLLRYCDMASPVMDGLYTITSNEQTSYANYLQIVTIFLLSPKMAVTWGGGKSHVF